MKKIIGYYRKCDLVTMLGTICSLVGVFLVFNKYYTIAVLCLVLSGICDMFDGKIARKHIYTKQQQVYGEELDSLSDIICFGVFPAIITSEISPFFISRIICCFYVLFGIIRLANFNTINITDKKKEKKFIGVPITTISIVYPLIFFILSLIEYNALFIVMPLVLLILGITYILNIEFPKPDTTEILKKVFNKYIINYLVFPIFVIFISDLFYRLNYELFLDSLKTVINNITSNLIPFIIMVIVVDIFLLILNSIFKKSVNAKIIILILLIIVLTINDIKLNIMEIPLQLSDFNYLNPDNIAMMGTATGTIGKWIKWVILKDLLVLVVGIIFILLDKKNEIVIEKKINRVIYAICGIILFSIFVLLTCKANNWILEKIYKTDSEKMISYSSVDEIYNEFGFWQGFYLNTLYNNSQMPEGYTKKHVTNLLEQYEDYNSANNWGKANVVFILSEAFSDLKRIDGIKFDKELTSNINSYENDDDKAVLDLLVPIYGGTSVNTEFEILTGGSLAFWKTGFIPYNEYYNKLNGLLAPNVIKEFNKNGYETVYITPWGETSFRSKFVYDLIGADRTIYGKDLNGEFKGLYYSDKSLMEDIYNELKRTSEGNYKFIMSATAQNHFEYNGDKYKEYDIEVVETSFNKEDTQILKNYAQGLYDADKELNNLYEMIQQLDVPTIIVFFGDHLPYTVDSNGIDPYTSDSYFQTFNNELNILRKYTTQAVILSNYDITIDDLEYINASYLGAYILNQMDLEISNYFEFIDNARKIIPVFNSSTIYKDGNTYSYEETSEEVINMLNNYKYVQYGSFYDFIK